MRETFPRRAAASRPPAEASRGLPLDRRTGLHVLIGSAPTPAVRESAPPYGTDCPDPDPDPRIGRPGNTCSTSSPSLTTNVPPTKTWRIPSE